MIDLTQLERVMDKNILMLLLVGATIVVGNFFFNKLEKKVKRKHKGQ